MRSLIPHHIEVTVNHPWTLLALLVAILMLFVWR